MIFYVLILHFSLFFLIWILWKTQKNYSPIAFFVFGVITIFYTPIIYYVFMNGTSYRVFSSIALKIFIAIGIYVFLSIGIILSIKVSADKKRPTKIILKRENGFFILYIFIILIVVLGYLMVFGNNLLLTKIFTNTHSDFVRSDTSGALPMWFTIATLISFIVPSFYFYFFNEFKRSLTKYIFFLIVAILTMVDGNKGIFVYLCIFVFIFINKYKVNIKLFFLGIISLLFYGVFKGIENFSLNNISYILTSSLRRFFVNQGSCFINRIEMILIGYPFDDTRISDQVAYFIDGSWGASAPTYYLGDFLVTYGIFLSLVMHLIVLIVLVYSSNILFYRYKGNLFLYWNYASVAYLLFMSELSFSHIIRIVIIAVNVCIYFLTHKKRFEVNI